MAEFIQYWKANSKRVIFVDRRFYARNLPDNPGRTFWESVGGMTTRAMHCMSLCDAVTVSTSRLQREYSFYNRKIHTLPNYIDRELWENL